MTTETPDHPLQPTVMDGNVIRFRENKLVSRMLDAYGHNRLAEFVAHNESTRDDYDQVLQLIGYSVSGAPLSEVTRARVELMTITDAPCFSTAYKQGASDALEKVRDALNEIEEDR